MTSRWLLYGAYGYTGRLLAREALRSGHRPVLAGRDPARLRALAEALGPVSGDGAAASPLPWRAFPLDDPRALEEGLEGVAAVLHAAGPFIRTAPPMLEACLAARVHYLDITAEVPVFERAFALDEAARRRGIALVPGVGIGVVPTSAAALLVQGALPSATRLELALQSPGGASAGTLRTILEGIPNGLLVRRGDRLVEARPGREAFRRRVHFGPRVDGGPMAGRLGGDRVVAPFTWGDLVAARHATGIGDITFYMARAEWQVRLLPAVIPVLKVLLASRPLRRLAALCVARGTGGPDEAERREGRVRVWARAESPEGRSAQAVLECPHGYSFTAIAGVRAVEELLSGRVALRGAFSPAVAFGVDWVLGLPGVEVVSRP